MEELLEVMNESGDELDSCTETEFKDDAETEMLDWVMDSTNIKDDATEVLESKSVESAGSTNVTDDREELLELESEFDGKMELLKTE
ncbi:hypothetical protein WICMUC_001736 [Wickerhamomyces mucosus]|uniref:Uncharacterized protein n=1 Tax=Wickerhamomyces mucosus TaxID=1378264 RepID=A0A9P8PSP9_9ASCO|nr:hypothetical protein WICMUC_001736 [Wickerhamomyces mucosus]